MRLDLFHLVRSVRRSPASAIAAVVTLAFTVGAGASIFAIVDAVLLTPPPFAHPDALVTIGEVPIDGPASAPRAVPDTVIDAWRQRATSIASIEAIDGTNLTLTGLGAAERISANDVTPGFLKVLGVAPVMGRSFGLDDVGRAVAIVSHTFWRQKLGADPAVIGRQIVLGGRAHTIVGVLPEAFFYGLNPSAVWRPLSVLPGQTGRPRYRVLAIARLAVGASPSQLAATLDDVSRASLPPSRAVVTPVAAAIARNSRTTLVLLAGAAGVALLIAFTNLAGLLMVRSLDRHRELALRNALGAGAFETTRQSLIEAAALVAVGTLLGIVLAQWMTPVAARLAVAQFGAVANHDVVVSAPVIGIVTAIACVCALICGSLPSFGAGRWSVAEMLRRGSTPAARELVLRRLFVGAEVALAFVLLVSMALLGRTLLAVLDVNPGFDSNGVIAMKVSLPVATYAGPDRVSSFYSTLQRALNDRLGAGTASLIDEVPLTQDRGRGLVSRRPADMGREAVIRTASPGYFDVMRIRLMAGRSFDQQDDAGAPLRVMLSESLASSLFGGEQAIGRRVFLAARSEMAEVIGVVGDVKLRALDEATLPTLYLSWAQVPSPSSILVIKAARPAGDVITTVRREVARLDGNLPVYGIQSMAEIVATSPGVPARRLLTAVFGAFALLAVVLSTIGLFGVAAHDVARRRPELAIRVALGARPMEILRATIGRSAFVVGCGLASGGLLSVGAVRALGGVLFASHGSDIASVGTAAAAVLIVTAVLAVLPAALRAARTDPLIVLRGD
ncbi:MAG TPA: ABC transporter permease [Vicinamibacterales bacterium]|jgi:predicted permease